uniref:Uncharacterized protein n=1 Tax=Anopheles merus TaxID=30066 RepID=A0A182V9J5_ANOME
MSEYPNLTIAARLGKHPPILRCLITDVVVVVFTPAITIHVRFACAGAVQPEPGSLVPAAQLRPMFAGRVRSSTASLAQLPLTGRILPGGSRGRRHAPAAMRQFLLRHGDAPSRQQHAPTDLSRLTPARQ